MVICKSLSVFPQLNLLKMSWNRTVLAFTVSPPIFHYSFSKPVLVVTNSVGHNIKLQNTSFLWIWSKTITWEHHLCSQLADKFLFHYTNQSLKQRWNILYSTLYPKCICRGNQMPPHPASVKYPLFSLLYHSNKLEDCQRFTFFILTEGKESEA